VAASLVTSRARRSDRVPFPSPTRSTLTKHGTPSTVPPTLIGFVVTPDRRWRATKAAISARSLPVACLPRRTAIATSNAGSSVTTKRPTTAGSIDGILRDAATGGDHPAIAFICRMTTRGST
jgi:hypothetical protein